MGLYFFKNRNKNLVIFLLVLLVVLVFVFFIVKREKEIIAPIKENKEVVRNFSRITFFNSNSKIKSSLAIPEDWEGKYRIKESGGKVEFSYIADPEKSYKFFEVGYSDLNEYEKSDSFLDITEKNGYIFYYRILKEDGPEGGTKDGYLKMIDDLKVVVDSFR